MMIFSLCPNFPEIRIVTPMLLSPTKPLSLSHFRFLRTGPAQYVRVKLLPKNQCHRWICHVLKVLFENFDFKKMKSKFGHGTCKMWRIQSSHWFRVNLTSKHHVMKIDTSSVNIHQIILQRNPSLAARFFRKKTVKFRGIWNLENFETYKY